MLGGSEYDEFVLFIACTEARICLTNTGCILLRDVHISATAEPLTLSDGLN